MKYVLGLDLARENFVAVLLNEDGEVLMPATSFANRTAEINQLLKQLEDPQQTHIVFESTGACSKRLIATLDGTVAGLHELNPQIVKRLASSMIQTKTDQADAMAIAHVGLALLKTNAEKLTKSQVSFDKNRENLALWLSEYHRLMRHGVALKLQIQEVQLQTAPAAKKIATCRRRELKFVQKQQQDIKKQIQAIMQQIDDHDAQCLQSIPGVGPLTAATTLVVIRSIDRFDSADALKGYLGVYPRRFQSGKTERPSRMAKHGNKLFRHMLWNAAKSAARHNPVCRELFDRLVEKGKSEPAAYGAVARKLVQIIYGVLKSRTPFAPQTT